MDAINPRHPTRPARSAAKRLARSAAVLSLLFLVSAARPAGAQVGARIARDFQPAGQALATDDVLPTAGFHAGSGKPVTPPELVQSAAQAGEKSRGCVQCHQGVGDMHAKDTVQLGCVDCHGGNAQAATKDAAHVQPCYPDAWTSSANPVRSYTLLNRESPEFIRFVNPGDLRVAHVSCGQCHADEVQQVHKSMMTHGCMLWGAALYNNGAVPHKYARFGESYTTHGVPARLVSDPPPTEWELKVKGVVPYLDPLPRFEMSQPANILRIFERGGRFRPETGIPERLEEPGRPRARLSNRGLGTENRTDPVFIGLQKTRLFDPTLNFLGTNDQPGDYRSSGCTACHVVYANDRSPVHSGPYAKFGNAGTYFGPDPTIPRDEPGHPIDHKFVKGGGVPTSQCIVCHIHPGTNVLNSYLGYMWWDEESDGRLLYPEHEERPTAEEAAQVQLRNPNESALRTRLKDPEFVARLSEYNDRTEHNHFADFHGHGWAFRAVFKRDRKGTLVDPFGRALPESTPYTRRAAVEMPNRLREPYYDSADKRPAELAEEVDAAERCGSGLPVHMLDIHLERGMHCVDCHFVQDAHGNNRLQTEVRAAIEIDCIDCHGTLEKRATLVTSGPAAYTSSEKGGRNLAALRTPFGRRRFEREGPRIYQNSMVEKGLRWEVTQVADTVDPQSPRYNVKSHYAKTVRRDDKGEIVWGGDPSEAKCAHQNEHMSCIACHTAWNPSCYGCHLPQRANKKAPSLHNEGDMSRNHVSYNFQTLREDVFMLAKDGNVTRNRIGPARSSCAVHVGSYNQNRESIYVQQQTVSADGYGGVAFSTNVPHTVRGGYVDPNDPHAFFPGASETKSCSDCHVSRNEDNNAILAQLLMHGTNYTNFIGRYCWVGAGEHGLEAVVVTEREEPQAVIGSTLHEMAFPKEFEWHERAEKKLKHAHEHPGNDIIENITRPRAMPEVLSLQVRGEFLYAACGPAGLRVFDVAFIDHKGFSERIVTAPVSPLGQRLYVRTAYATAVAAPSTVAVDPTRQMTPLNGEQPIHPIYAYLYVADRFEGLILVGAGTLLDGNPTNNFLEREVTFNPGGILCGAETVTIVGTYAYVGCDAGLVVVDLSDPKSPKVASVLHDVEQPTSVQIQFRYGFVCDHHGITVLDTTDLAHPTVVKKLPLEEAHSIYLARTYAYVAAGSKGLVILDITTPSQPKVDQVYNAEGKINDLHDVKLGITYTSQFAYLADGCNGLHVVQLTSPETPGNEGFSPRPQPRLIASHKLPKGGKAHCVSEGLDRDRAVDESGNQVGVFGRVGARPLNLKEQQKMYLHQGQVWRVSDDPAGARYLGDRLPPVPTVDRLPPVPAVGRRPPVSTARTPGAVPGPRLKVRR